VTISDQSGERHQEKMFSFFLGLTFKSGKMFEYLQTNGKRVIQVFYRVEQAHDILSKMGI
jgi:hypothetical protein